MRANFYDLTLSGVYLIEARSLLSWNSCMIYRGHVKNGQIAFDEPVSLPEGAAVCVDVVETPTENGDAGEATIWAKLLEIAGNVEGLPPDMAQHHDHYLHGTPKLP
jgi:hypothetical protein